MKACILCKNLIGNIEFKPSFKFVSSDIKKVRHNSTFIICKNCGTLQKKIDKKYVKNISEIYKKYQGFSKLNQIDQTKILKGMQGNRCNLIYKKFLKSTVSKNILDYGCSNGAMLFPFLNSNNKLYATDLKHNLNKKILKSKNFKKFYSMKKFKISKKKYDLITLIHVLENPVETIIELSSKLKEKGKIFIQIPNFTLNPYDLNIYDHTLHFDKNSIFKLAELCNLNVRLLNDKYIDGEFSILLNKGKNSNKIKKISKKNKIQIIKNHQNTLLRSKKINNLSILGTSISSLCIAHNYPRKIVNFYDEDISKIEKFIFGKKIKRLVKNEKINLFLPFYSKKLINIKKRLKSNYDYKLKC